MALALSPDGHDLAAATIGGAVAIVDRAEARVRLTLVGPGLPVWSLASAAPASSSPRRGDRLVRLWDLRTASRSDRSP